MLIALLIGCQSTDWCQRFSLDCTLDSERPTIHDADGDVWPDSEDCDDRDDAVFPGAVELCDGIDNNCDGIIDEGSCPSPLSDVSTTLTGAANSDAGITLTLPGDLNADGVPELLVSAPAADAAVAWLLSGMPATSTLAEASVAQLVVPDARGDALSLAGVGDLNGDGYGEVLVGAPGSGQVWLSHGPHEGTVLLESAALLSTADSDPDDATGYSLAALSDGHLAIGAPGLDDATTNAGAVYLLSPQRTAAPAISLIYGEGSGQLGHSIADAGDVDGDGVSDLIIGGPGLSAAYLVLLGARFDNDVLEISSADQAIYADDGLLGYAVSAAGDLDGDGLSEVIIGAPGVDDAGTDAGAAFVFAYTGGVHAATDAMAIIDGTGDYSRAGYSVSMAGDVTGDGLAGVVIGAPGDAYGATRPGAAAVLPGPLSGRHSIADTRLIGSGDSSLTGTAVAGGTDLDGDGRSEVIIGAPGADAVHLFSW